MAATTTAINACDAVIQLDDDLGALQDISGSSNNAELGFTQEVGEYQVFGGGWVKRLACARDATLSLSLVYTTATDEAMDVLKDWFFSNPGTKRTCQIDVPDSTSGNDRYSGEFYLVSLDIPLDVEEAGPIMCSAELAPDGGVTLAVIP